jgi:DNA-binding transcriptional LysR family regulator
MASAEPSWELYRSFLAVLDAGSLSSAARTLRLAQPTLGRHIRALEKALGTALFTRSRAGLEPTDSARALERDARAMASAAAALARTASGPVGEARGAIRLTAADIVGVEVLPPMLTRFREAHPGIEIELALSNDQQDLLRRDADIAVRMARPAQGALRARRIGQIRLPFCAHESYLAAHGTPTSLAELTGHTLIGYDRLEPPARVGKALGLAITRDLFALRTDNELAQLAHLRAGFGILPCQPLIAARSEGLVPILADRFAFDLEVWVVMHEDLALSRRMRLLFDWLVEGMKAYVAASERVTRRPP